MYELARTRMIPWVVSQEANTRSGMVELAMNAFSKDKIKYCVMINCIIFFQFWRLSTPYGVGRIICNYRLLSNKDTFSNILQEIGTEEEVIRVPEVEFEANLPRFNLEMLHKAHVDEGERNTNFFPILVKGRRGRKRVNIIENEEEKWLEDQEGIVGIAVEFNTL
ncbi:hypothetical protein H5410_027701 [Solanum commersonii]|uniref:Uncharacterized protein n=1 Tax=Solanum commersonii TaxID=4109 RepID=A0A9J5YZX5_SOLCO|nr:hypothetical protein H5410_027701 [Solanum commersonii]